METCPICHGPLGGPWGNRCYRCKGRPKTGRDRTCVVCGSTFYAPGWVIRDTARNSGTYCSRACKHAGMTGRELVFGTTSVQRGYRWVKVGCRKRKLEHRLVVEVAIGRILGRREEVHHLNGDKLDNRLENLLVVSPSEHQTYHTDHVQFMRRRVILACQACGKSYERKASRAAESKFCSNACRIPAMRAARKVGAA